MPALGGALRAWASHPQQREPRDQVLRALHTLKGSARLAGALQLGELAARVRWSTSGTTTCTWPTSRRCCSASTPCRRASTAARHRWLAAGPARRSGGRAGGCARAGRQAARGRSLAGCRARHAGAHAHRDRHAGADQRHHRAPVRQPGGPRALAAAGPAGQPGRRGDDHPFAARIRTAPAARLAGRPHGQPGPPAFAGYARSRCRPNRRCSRAWRRAKDTATAEPLSSTASPACRN